MQLEDLAKRLEAHEALSQERYEELCQLLEGTSMEGINSDKVNINLGGADSGSGGGAGLAAVIAALGNRNQGDNIPALIAAMGNRNDDRRGSDGDGFLGGGGGGILGLIALLSLFRRGGLGGDEGGEGNGCARTALTQTILEAVGAIRAQVPQTALETQNQICQTSSALALGIQQGLANVKDSVQNLSGVELAAIAGVKDAVQNGFTGTTIQLLNGLCDVKTTVREDGDRTRGQIALYHEATLQRQLGVAEAALAEERGVRRIRDVEVSVTQTVNQNQVQAQQQQQQQQMFSQLFTLLHGFSAQLNAVRQGQDTINFGTMAASGNQANTSSQVNR